MNFPKWFYAPSSLLVSRRRRKRLFRSTTTRWSYGLVSIGPVLTKVPRCASRCASKKHSEPRAEFTLIEMYPVALGTKALHFGYGVGMPIHDGQVLQRSS
jgi:hypothetical protein